MHGYADPAGHGNRCERCCLYHLNDRDPARETGCFRPSLGQLRHAGDRTRPTPYRKADPGEHTETETRMTTPPLQETCLIVDFGSQVTQRIARRLRESGVYCEIHPFQSVDDALIDRLAPKAVILSGGPASLSDEGSPRANQRLFELGVPVLGICYGQIDRKSVV